MNIWTILAIYWVVCCLAVYIIRNRDTFYNKKKLKFQEYITTFYKNTPKFQDHITTILFFPLAVPFLLLYFMYKGWQQFYYKDRPRPVPIFLRSHPLKTIFQHKACTDKLYADSFYKVQKNSHSSFEVICCRS